MSVHSTPGTLHAPSTEIPPGDMEPPNVPVRVYGLWSTLAWGVSSYLVSVAGAYLVGLVVATAWSFVIGPLLMYDVEITPTLLDSGVEGLMAPFNAGAGVVRAACTLALPLFGILVLWGVTSKRALRPLDYFGSFSISPRDAIRWTPLLLASLFGPAIFVFLFSSRAALLGDIALCRETCRFLSSAIIAGLAITIMAPLHEELLFRGFLFRGLERSRIGGLGATVLTSALWTVAHWDRGYVPLLVLFVQGLAIGWVRYRSKSLGLPLLFHMGMNVLGFLPAAIVALHGG